MRGRIRTSSECVWVLMMKTCPPDEAQRCSSTASMDLTGRTPSFSTVGLSQFHKPSVTTHIILMPHCWTTWNSWYNMINTKQLTCQHRMHNQDPVSNLKFSKMHQVGWNINYDKAVSCNMSSSTVLCIFLKWAIVLLQPLCWYHCILLYNLNLQKISCYNLRRMGYPVCGRYCDSINVVCKGHLRL